MRIFGIVCAAALGVGAAVPSAPGPSSPATVSALPPGNTPTVVPAPALPGGSMEEIAGRGTSAATGEEERPQYWFGVAVEYIPPAIARQLKLKQDQGLMIAQVFPGTPAETAGLKKDDLLIELNDKPLTSRGDLARAANPPVMYAISDRARRTPAMQATRFTFLRDGDRQTVQMTAAARPVGMMVVNAMPSTGPARLSAVPPRSATELRNILLPNGQNFQVGPGFQLSLNGPGTTVRALREALSDGQQVTILQETDAAGAVKNSINVGDKKYPVVAGKLGELPANIRPLAEQMLANAPGASAGGEAGVGRGSTAAFETVLKSQQQLIEAQQKQMQEMQAQFTEMQREFQTLLKAQGKSGETGK